MLQESRTASHCIACKRHSRQPASRKVFDTCQNTTVIQCVIKVTQPDDYQSTPGRTASSEQIAWPVSHVGLLHIQAIEWLCVAASWLPRLHNAAANLTCGNAQPPVGCCRGQQPSLDGLLCVTCPQNRYKSTVGSTLCQPCPEGLHTAGRKRSNHDSSKKCLAGKHGTNGGVEGRWNGCQAGMQSTFVQLLP